MLKCITTDVNKSYVGYTNNLKLRLDKHNSNKGAKSTKGYKWILIYSKKFNSKLLVYPTYVLIFIELVILSI